MTRTKWIGLAILALLVVMTPLAIREGRHWFHYHQIESEGELRAKINVVVPKTAACDSTVTCTAEVKNMGNANWCPQAHYFALGIYTRNMVVKRQPTPFRITGSTVPDRVIVPKTGVRTGKQWHVSFELQAPLSPGHYLLCFQMVQEGVTWFGWEESKVIEIQ